MNTFLPSSALSDSNRLWMMAALCMGAFISHFTAGVVTVSLPLFANVFDSDVSAIQWITTGYLLVIVVLLPVMGTLGDRVGHRFIHNAGYLFFTVSSLLVAFSPNITVLLVLRTAQAIGAAMFQGTNIAIITLHIAREHRGRALGTMSTAVALGGMTGPIAGGFIAEWANWPWLFLVHVPIALIATVLAWRYIPNQGHSKKAAPFDVAGMLLFALFIGTAIFGVSNGNTVGWLSIGIIALFVVSFIAMVVLLIWESRRTAPFLPLDALRIPAVLYGLIVSCASFVLANIVLVSMPFYFTGVVGVSPLTLGYIMCAYPVLLAFAGPFAGRMSDRYGPKPFLFLGLAGMGGGLAFLSVFLEHGSTFGIIAVLGAIGVGMGLVASPNNSFIVSQAPKEQVGSIGGLIALTRNTGMVLGSALALGAIQGAAYPGPDSLLEPIRHVLQMGIWICLASLVMLVCGVAQRKSAHRSQQNE